MATSRSMTPDAMMGALVMGNTDVVGLLAYAIYSQFRDEWRIGFTQSFGREPTAHELAVYELGEQTSRRAMTYRFLADARVMGRYADTRGAAKDAFVQKVYEAGARAAIREPTDAAFRRVNWRPSLRVALAAMAVGSALVFGLGRTNGPFVTATAMAVQTDQTTNLQP